MAPEVIKRGVSYGCEADWFSYGCTLFKLLRGHSPFRHHKSKDKAEIDKVTLTVVSSRLRTVGERKWFSFI